MAKLLFHLQMEANLVEMWNVESLKVSVKWRLLMAFYTLD